MEQKKTTYQSPVIRIYALRLDGRIMNGSNNGEMGNGGFLDE